MSNTPSKKGTALRLSLPCVGLLCTSITQALAADVKFNPAFIKQTGGAVDLSYFEKGSPLAPGSYGIDVYLNDALIQRREVDLIVDAQSKVMPLLSATFLSDLGVDVARLEREGLISADPAAPIDLPAQIPGARSNLDAAELALRISIPQAYLLRKSRGYVDPSLWDTGINAFHTNYQINFNRSERDGVDDDYLHLGLRSGFNLGGWRVRNDASLSSSSGQPSRVANHGTYLEHDVQRLDGTFSVGDLFTPGDIFGSIRFRGAQLRSDIGMLSDDAQGYAPVVRGIAETHATVEIKQNGYVIHSITVPPGAFEITDLYPNGSNGDLLIRILESDGRVRESTQSYAYLPVMARLGAMRYQLAAGEYRDAGQSAFTPTFAQATMVYGMGDSLTLFGGALASSGYKALNLGVGLNSAVGGLSLDVTRSESQRISSATDRDYSARLLYAKTLTGTRTTLTMAGYRYSTEGFRTFGEHVVGNGPLGSASTGRQKSRLDLNVNQWFGEYGSLYASIGEASYWNLPGRTRNWQLGYSGNFGRVNYNLAYSRARSGRELGREDTQINATFSIPLGRKAGSNHRMFATHVNSQQGASSTQVGASGSLGKQSTLSYGIQANRTVGSDSSIGVGLEWQTPTTRLSGNYNQSRDYRQASIGAAGSVLLHRGGVTLGQPVSETFGLIEVPKVRGAELNGWARVRTDRRGYAVVPHLQPYRLNWVELSTPSLGTDTDVADSTARLIPTRGAVVRAHYAAESGRRVQLELRRQDTSAVPFGAMVYDADGRTLGMVDNLSRVLIFSAAAQGQLDVRWNSGSCRIDYTLPARNNTLAYDSLALTCQ